MRRTAGLVLLVVVAVLVLAGCGSDGDSASSSTSSAPSSTAAPTTSTTNAAQAECMDKLQAGGTINDCQTPPSSTAATTPTTEAPATTTTPACPPAGSTAPFASPPSASPANVLRTIKVTGQRCSDRVVFRFRPAAGPPQCTVKYAPGPFSEDASGKPVTVSGAAFLVVRCEPARSYDLSSGQPTYTAPADKHTPVTGAQHVTDLVATGDFEGVMSWVIGVDGQRPFSGTALDTGALVVAVF